MKRLLDLILVISGLLLCGLLVAVTAILIRRKLGSPVLFKQERPGLHGRPFILYKFRTMTDEQDEQGSLLSDEVRLTSFGRRLRKLSLDELPQLYNVLKGDMSLVGPRPLLMEYLTLYTEEQSKRNLVRPGITGLAQINGRNAISWEEKLKWDVLYVENRTLWLDVKIIYFTFIKVFKSEGVTQAGYATTDRFRGTQSLMRSEHL